MSKKILVVDDSATVRQQVIGALKEAGYDYVEAVDGMDALEKVSPEIAMMICDVNMPRLNGLDTLERLRADERFASLPVLMLTTEGQPEMVARAKRSGAKGWLIKPFHANMLIAAVKRLAG